MTTEAQNHANRLSSPNSATTPNKPPIQPKLSTNYAVIITNKANFPDAQMNVNKVLTKEYESQTLGKRGKNKPNSNPIKANFPASRGQKNPIQTQNKPNQTHPVVSLPALPALSAVEGSAIEGSNLFQRKKMLLLMTIYGRQRFFTKIASIPFGRQNHVFELFSAVLQDYSLWGPRRRGHQYEKRLDFGGQIWSNSINRLGVVMNLTSTNIYESSSLILAASYAVWHLTLQRNNEMDGRDSAGKRKEPFLTMIERKGI